MVFYRSEILGKFLLLTLFIIESFCLTVQAQENKVPLEIQFALLPKVLLLEKNISAKENKIRVGIIYDSSIRTSLRIKEKIYSFVENSRYKKDNEKFSFISIDIADEVSVDSLLKSKNLDAIYLTSVSSSNVAVISSLCKKNKYISFTGIEEYFDQGISILFDIKNNKPKITINMEAAKNEGAAFSSYLLRLANIINNS